MRENVQKSNSTALENFQPILKKTIQKKILHSVVPYFSFNSIFTVIVK